MKSAYVILISVALGFVVWDILTQTFDFYFNLVSAVLIALTAALVALEKREQQS
jgi:uncharacterized membrane-anchored protein